MTQLLGGTELNSWHPDGGSQPPVTSIPGDQTTFGLMDTRHTGSTQTYIKAEHPDTSNSKGTEHLPSMYKALGLIHTQRGKKEKEIINRIFS